MFINLQAFCICQLRSQNIYTQSYEERTKLCNLENGKFEELMIQLTLSYYNRYFHIAHSGTGGRLGWRNMRS